MTFSKCLKIHHDHATNENLIFIGDLYKFLTKAGDSDLKKYNINRALRTFQGEKKIFQGEESATFQAVLRYLCFHSERNGCKSLLNSIEQEITNCNTTVQKSTYDLYKLIAKTHINRTSLLFNNLEISETEISTLMTDHRSHFTELEWKRICWFEHDFSKFVEFRELSYEEMLSCKCSRFQNLLSLSECCQNFCILSKNQIRDLTKRIKKSEKQSKVRLRANQTHIATVVDNDVKCFTDLYCPSTIEYAVCFDVTQSSINNVLWAVLIQNDEIGTDFGDLCTRVFYALKRRHGVYLEKVLLMDQTATSQFILNDGTLFRFLLRDAIETGKIHSILGSWTADTLIDGTIDLKESQNCEYCFAEDKKKKTLSQETFNVVEEWFLGIPLEMQVILEQFLNIKTIMAAKVPEELLKSKLERLYFVNDTLLNIYNKQYIGFIQKNNANKLLMEYKSIGSVFEITSSIGATPGLNYAEEKLKNESNADLCYYNTYLKEHAIEYEAKNECQQSSTSLRKCHLILMLDNLVRLQYITDPDPGVHRSKQLCTIPITVQGLPTDSKITDEWHLPDCDATFNCVCKHPVQLSCNQVFKLLTELTDREKKAHTDFFNWMSFGHNLIWKGLPDELLEQIEGNHADQPYILHQQRLDSMESQEDNLTEEDETDCQDEDLIAVLNKIECDLPDEIENQSFSDNEDELLNISHLEKSMDEMSILEEQDSLTKELPKSIPAQLKEFGFEKFIVPPLLCRHPPPAIGRDDDIEKIQEVLDDVLIKCGYQADPTKNCNRILCGPDNKIGKCLFKLMDRDTKYRIFLPEFPLLHLRKSKINILISAYKSAGLLEIIQVMRNDEKNDWGNLISIQHIDIASRHVRRLAMALNLAFLVKFIQNLENNDLQEFLSDMEGGDCRATSEKWSKSYSDFLNQGCTKNSTFALHFDMMQHCNDIVAIQLSERLGGERGYNLLLGAVKNSLLFSFVNGASSYAPYSAQLLLSHYTAGHFHQCLKRCLYTTPLKNSGKNFASDTKREMDHQEIVKGFRSGSNIESVTCRMSLIDSLNEVSSLGSINKEQKKEEDRLGMDITETDINHVYPAALLILRRGGLSTEESTTPINVYSKTPLTLPLAILDSASNEVAKYLLKKYLNNQNLLSERVTHNTDIEGPKELVDRAKRSKGITIKRVQVSKVVPLITERQTKELSRVKAVAKQTKILDAISSENNACQALLKPDSSKPKVAKSLSIPRALKNAVISCSPIIPIENYISLNLTHMPRYITGSTKLCIVEFAGMKFKMGYIKSGNEYIHTVERYLASLIKDSVVEQIVICEEKYSFTPDDFKASTREQRQQLLETDVCHLKTEDRVLSESVFDYAFITKTGEGKRLISNYLAKNLQNLRMERNADIIVDSEFVSQKGCEYTGTCDCQKLYSIPLKCKYQINKDPVVSKLSLIKQNKGEAEMSAGDWLINLQDELNPGQNVVCYATNGDIDTLVIYLYAVSQKWRRKSDGSFKNDVFVALQKQGGKVDVYNVTSLLTLLEEKYNDRKIGLKIAFSLCLGGNDFIPKLFGISHDTILRELLGNIHFRSSLFELHREKIIVNKNVLLELVKTLYTPKRHRSRQLSYNDVRAVTINKKEDKEQKCGFVTSHPRNWLPPATVIERLGVLLQLQVEYIETVGIHNSRLPPFIESGVLRKNASEEIEYDFGPESHFDSIQDLPCVKLSKKASKRNLDNTPQHGARRKRQLVTSTPKKILSS